MTDSIVLTGVVATAPRSITTAEGLAITSFRLASTLRRFDRATSTWKDGGTNWYSVSAFRRLAANVSSSLQKGDRIVVAGRVRVREWESAGRSGMTVEVDAEAIGHDLNWGTSIFTRGEAGASKPDEAGGESSEADAQAAQDESAAAEHSAAEHGEVSWGQPLVAAPF